MGGSRYHAEIVDVDGVVDAVDQGLDPPPGLLGDAVVRHHRVHVDHCVATQLLPQLLLHVVDLIVEGQHILVGGHLRVEGDHHPAGAVVVDDQIVDAQNGAVGHHQIPDALDELMGGRRAQQGVQRVPHRIDAGPENKGRHQHAAPAVDLQARETAHQRGDQHRGGGHTVAEGVHGGGLHGGRGQLLPQPPVVEEHIQLHQNGRAEDRKDQRAGVYRFRMQDLLNGRLPQLQAHQQDQDRYRQAGDVLHPPVAEGVFGVRLLPRQLKPHQCHEGGPGVRQVVEGVRRDGDGPGEGARQKLSGEQQHVQADAHNPAEDAVGPAGLRLFPGRVRFDKQPRQQ